DLARDRLHSQRRRSRRACRDHRLLRRPGPGRPLSRDGRGPAYPAPALQRPQRPPAGPARHRLRLGIRIRRADPPAAHSSRFAPFGGLAAVDRRLCGRLTFAVIKRGDAWNFSNRSTLRPSPSCWRSNMKIAQIAPLMESVPPRLYGGSERIVSYLTDELVRLGHKVTLFASGDSVSSAKPVPCVPIALRLDSNVPDIIPYYMRMLY